MYFERNGLSTAGRVRDLQHRSDETTIELMTPAAARCHQWLFDHRHVALGAGYRLASWCDRSFMDGNAT